MTKILRFTVEDVRFPTSKDLTGSDAIHTDPDYSATYITVFTNDPNLEGYGIAFTLGKGNDIVAECIKHFFPIFENMDLENLENEISDLSKKLNIGLETITTRAKSGFRTEVDVTPEQKERIYSAFESSNRFTGYEI